MNPINVTGYDRDEHAAWAAEENKMGGIWVVFAHYTDGGAPILLACSSSQDDASTFAQIVEKTHPGTRVSFAGPVPCFSFTNAPEGIAK